MEKVVYGAGLGITNKYDVLSVDELVDPLEAIMKTTKNKKKNKAKAKSTGNEVKPAEQPKDKKQTCKPKGNQKKETDAEPSTSNTEKPARKKKTYIKKERPTVERNCHEISFDEYREETLAIRRARNKPEYNLRIANEGEDETKWKKLVPLPNKKYEEEEEVVVGVIVIGEVLQRVGRQRRLPVQVTFGDNHVRRRWRPRFGPLHQIFEAFESNPPQQRPPRVDNETEFPALGK